MLKLTKGDAVKFLSPESSLIAKLEFEGWAVEGSEVKESLTTAVEVKNDELDALRAKAEALGLKPHHKAGAEKIKEMIEAVEK